MILARNDKDANYHGRLSNFTHLDTN